MLEIMIAADKREIESQLDNESLRIYAKLIREKLEEKRFLSGCYTHGKVSYGSSSIKIEYTGIFFSDVRSKQYIQKIINMLLEEIGLKSIIACRLVAHKAQADDKIYTSNELFKLLKPNTTAHASLLEHYNIPDEKIPDEFKCVLSTQLIDSPVYVRDTPQYKYEAEVLKYWLTVHKSEDPFTRKAVNPNFDIIPDLNLKSQIIAFVNQTTREALLVRSQQFRAIMKKYEPSGFLIKDEQIERAFRRAAAANKVDDLKILQKRVVDINCTDQTPNKRKSALHWAVEKGSLEAIKYLLSEKASVSLPDASGKTVLDYVRESTNEELKSLFKISNSDHREFSSRQNGAESKSSLHFS